MKNQSSQKNLTGEKLLRIFEALANPHRLHIISLLTNERNYVSELARKVNMSRPLLYMHLQRLEKADMVTSKLELSDDGKAKKYYELKPFSLNINAEVIAEIMSSTNMEVLLDKKKGRKKEE
jgi:predicted transcriptional regulator